MEILGVPEGTDRGTIRPTGDWPLSTRYQREIMLRDEMVAAARDAFDLLCSNELRAMLAAMLDADLRAMGGGDPPPGFPDAATMTREATLDYLADGAIGYVPDIEVVHPARATRPSDAR